MTHSTGPVNTITTPSTSRSAKLHVPNESRSVTVTTAAVVTTRGDGIARNARAVSRFVARSVERIGAG